MKSILKMSRKIANLSGHIFYPKNYPLDIKNVPKISLKKLQIQLDIFYIQKISIGHEKYPQNV